MIARVTDALLHRHPAGFLTLVVGRSMEPTLLDGDIVFVDPHLEPRDGAIVTVLINYQRLIGRLSCRGDALELRKDNLDYETPAIPAWTAIVGVVVAIARRDVGLKCAKNRTFRGRKRRASRVKRIHALPFDGRKTT